MLIPTTIIGQFFLLSEAHSGTHLKIAGKSVYLFQSCTGSIGISHCIKSIYDTYQSVFDAFLIHRN